MLVAALGDGAAHGVRLQWSLEPEPLETAGGIATALPLLGSGTVVIVSGDIWTTFDYAPLLARAAHRAHGDVAGVHLVMVPNPPFHPRGDFVLGDDGRITLDAARPRLTFGNIGLYDTALFAELPRGVKLKLLPLFERWIRAGIVSGELYGGPWANVGSPEELARLDSALAAHTKHRHGVDAPIQMP
jgi:MurNAc alpha-1-phosphate uridylyltransferase